MTHPVSIKDFSLHDRVSFRHQGMEVEGNIWMIWRFPAGYQYAVQTEEYGLVKDLTADKLKPIGRIEAENKQAALADFGDRAMPPVLVKG